MADDGEDDLVCLDLNGCRCTDLADVNAADAARTAFAFLQHNHLSLWTDFIHFQSPLRVLDLSHNLFISLPAGSFWDAFPCLQLLYLDSNAITSVASLASLARLKKLSVVSFARNPVAVKTGYRLELLNTLPHLAMIDDYIVSDQERLRQWNLGPLLIPTTGRFQFPRLAVMPGDGPHVCRLRLELYLQHLHAAEERLSPIRTLQRWWKIQRNRRKMLEERMTQMTGRLQRQPTVQDLKRRITRQASKASSVGSTTHVRLNSVSKSDDEVDDDNGTTRTVDVEYDTRKIRRRAEIQEELNTIVLVGRDRTGAFSRLILQARAVTPGSHVPDDDLVVTPVNIRATPTNEFKVAVRNRTLTQAVANNKALQPNEPNILIGRRLCHPCRMWRESFGRGWSENALPDEDFQVYRFKTPSIGFRESLLRLIASYNFDAAKRGLNPLNVLLYRYVLEWVSAGRIQCLWRGWRHRRQFAAYLYEARRWRRAAVCLTQAWRNYLLRLRFCMLRDASAICNAIKSPKLFLSRPALDLLLTAPNPFRRLQLFPEHRISFSVAEGTGDRVVLYSKNPLSRPSPTWLGNEDFDVEIAENECNDDNQLRLGLRDLIQRHTASELKVLPQNRTVQTTESLWLFEFPSIRQAQLRAFLLLVHTWDPITRTFCHARPAMCNTEGIWIPIGSEIEPPTEYRNVPKFSSAADDSGDEAARAAVIPIIRSHVNENGVDKLIHFIDRELVEIDPEVAESHGLKLPEYIEEATIVDDLIDIGDFLLPDLEIDDYDQDLETRMRWQAMNLQLEAFYPNAEENTNRAEIGLHAKMALADSVRKESDYLNSACQTDREQDLERKKRTAQTLRDLHQSRLNMYKIQARQPDDHCKSEIINQRRQRLDQLRSLINKAKMRKRQFQKDQMVEKRIAQVQRHTDRINERQQLIDAKLAADGAARSRVNELHSVAQTAQIVRANRHRLERDGLHFRRQLCQISKQIRSAQAQEAANLRAAITARDVQVRKIRDARLRQTVHDRLLSEFSRKRQNAIVQQLRVRDQIEQKRNQEQYPVNKSRIERRQMRQIQKQIAEEIATCRDVLRVDLAAHEFDDITSNLTRSMDADLTSRLNELEALANNVRMACTRVFNNNA